jgi:hypothetical protein
MRVGTKLLELCMHRERLGRQHGLGFWGRSRDFLGTLYLEATLESVEN